MPYSTERERRISMLRAAIPYVSPDSKRAMEILLQTDSLISLATRPSLPDDDYTLRAAEDTQTTDPEAMLIHIKEYCTPKESDTIQMLLNFMHADKLFRNYREFASSHSDLLQASDISNQNQSPLNILFQLINGLGSLGTNQTDKENSGSNIMMEFLMAQLSPEQKATFEQLQNIMYNQ